MSGSSVNKVTQQHHEMMTSLLAPAQEKPRAQITEGKGRSSLWQLDRAGCKPPSNIRPGSVAKNYPGATPASAHLPWAASGPRMLRTTEYHQWGFFSPHFLEERLPTARIKIEYELCHRNPVQSKHTHILQWPWGDRADKQNLKVIITVEMDVAEAL